MKKDFDKALDRVLRFSEKITMLTLEGKKITPDEVEGIKDALVVLTEEGAYDFELGVEWQEIVRQINDFVTNF